MVIVNFLFRGAENATLSLDRVDLYVEIFKPPRENQFFLIQHYIDM